MNNHRLSFQCRLTAAIFAAVSCVYGHAYGQSYVPEYANAVMKVRPAVAVTAYPFSIRDVTLLDGPFKEAMEADEHYLLEVEPDRLLSYYRVQAGLVPKGPSYGGWEGIPRMRGPAIGFYLSACALAYAASHDARFLDKVNYIVSELAACQDARAAVSLARPVGGTGDSGSVRLMSMSGYVGAMPREDTMWSEVAAGKIRSHGGFDLNGGGSPWYVVHKVMAGLLDAYYYCGSTKALQVEKGMADWTASVVAHLPDSTMQKMLLCEYGGMNEVLANTYAVTGDKKYLSLSYKFYDKIILDSLSMGLDDLAEKHSNTQVPKMIGCARRYELTGDDRDKRIAENFWAIVTEHHSYATGGNSDYEYFGAADKLNDELTDATTETCVTYNMLKLTRHLFAWHPSAALMDYYEKALDNHILASQNHDDGMMCYYVPLRMGGRKEYSDRFNTFTCCVGTGMENHVKYGESIYSRGKDGSLYVNLFIASRLRWKEKGITLEQQTGLPANDEVLLTLSETQPGSRFALRIRKPYWAGPGLTVTVNGAPVQDLVTGSDGYLVIDRMWKKGDRIEVRLPESFHKEALADNTGRVAVFYGPVLLAGELGDREPDPVKGVPVVVTVSGDPNQWVQRVGGESANGSGGDQLVFRTKAVGQPGDVTLIPFNRTKNEYYSVYWDVFTPDGWAIQQKKYEEERRLAQDVEDRTIDRLRLNEMQPERDHSFTGDSLYGGEAHGKRWRSTEHGGEMSFVMKVDSSTANELVCTYWGDEYHERERVFDIRVDGRTIATVDMHPYRQSRFYEVSYPVPQELVKGKQSVTVKLVARSAHNGVGPVSGTIRMVRN